MLRSHVDELGKRIASVKCRLGIQSKPAAGILLAPDMNCRMSDRATPVLPSTKAQQTSKLVTYLSANPVLNNSAHTQKCKTDK